MHHIIPEAKGGTNTSDNAIVLCFDCHADAGSYNPEHPRGTRISPEELRRAREEWYGIVATGCVESPNAELTPFHCRYIIGKNFTALRELMVRDLSRFPIPGAILVNSATLRFLEFVIQAHGKEYRSGNVHGGCHPTGTDYLARHGDAEIRPTGHQGGFQYFTFEREPSREELIEKVAPEDAITRLLLEAGVPERRIARALAYEDGCGCEFPEIYCTRPLWGVFLAITNVSGEPVALSKLVGRAYGRDFRDVLPMHAHDAGTLAEIPFPRAKIAPSQTVIVPVSVVLGPLDHFPVQEGYTEHADLEQAHWQNFTHVQASQERTWASYTWGPAFFPHRIEFESGGFPLSQSVHELNLSNVYEIDRHWGMGSCPHAFVLTNDNAVRYLGEVLPSGSKRIVTDTLSIPPDAQAIVIAELEEETTHLIAIRDGGETILSDQVLDKGEFVLLRPRSRELVIEGSYQPKYSTEIPQPLRRNELVGNFGSVLPLYRQVAGTATPPP